MTAEVLRLTSAESTRQMIKHHNHPHNIDSKVVITPGPFGMPMARHEITITQGTRTRTLKSIGFIQPRR